jgi:tight adherence protein B
MDITTTQIIYGLVFVSIVFAVEGLYLNIRGADRREMAANRRMKVAQNRDMNILNPSIMREEVIGGPISRQIFSLMPKLEEMFWVANIKTSPAIAVAIAVAMGVAAYLGLRYFVTMPPLLSFAAAAAFSCGIPFLWLNMLVSRQRSKFSTQLPDAINLITRGLQAGHPVPVAFELVAREMEDPLGGQFGKVIDEINFGRDRDQALRDVSKKFPDPDFKFFLAAVEMQRETGGNLVDILDNLSKIIRERANMKKKAWAVSAEGRLTLMIVGTLPYLLLAWMLLTNPSFILNVLDHPLFWPMMGSAWVLWLIGVLWIWRMVNIKV